jgi:DNA-binding IclR family transcriptional regulator
MARMTESTEPTSSETAPAGGIQVLARAGRILRALDGEHDGLSLAELAARVGLPRSTVHRLVRALHAEGLVTAASGNGGVRLGPELMRLALGMRREIRQTLHPEIAALSGKLQETVDLSVLEGNVVRFIDQIASPRLLRAVSFVGATFPLHLSANGKAVLAALPEDDALALLPATLEPNTESSITSRAALLRELDDVRERGYAYDREEHHEGITAIGVALRDPLGPLVAISVPIPTQRFPKVEARAIEALLETQRRCQSLLDDAPGEPRR